MYQYYKYAFFLGGQGFYIYFVYSVDLNPYFQLLFILCIF